MMFLRVILALFIPNYAKRLGQKVLTAVLDFKQNGLKVLGLGLKYESLYCKSNAPHASHSLSGQILHIAFHWRGNYLLEHDCLLGYYLAGLAPWLHGWFASRIHKISHPALFGYLHHSFHWVFKKNTKLVRNLPVKPTIPSILPFNPNLHQLLKPLQCQTRFSGR